MPTPKGSMTDRVPDSVAVGEQPVEQEASEVEEPKAPRSGLLKSGVSAREAGLKGVEARRQRKAAAEARLQELGTGPREAIALALHERLDLLQQATVKALEDAASNDPSLRRSGRQALPRLLDQALGRVEEHRPASPVDSDLTSIPREERTRMIAELRAQLAAEPSDDEGYVGKPTP